MSSVDMRKSNGVNFVPPQSFLCKQWKIACGLAVGAYFLSLLLYWANGNFLSSDDKFCRYVGLRNSDMTIARQNMYVMGLGLVSMVFAYKFVKFLALPARHEHAWCLRAVCLVFLFLSLVSCSLLSVPDFVESFFRDYLCIHSNGRTSSIIIIIDRVTITPLIYYITMATDYRKAGLSFDDIAVLGFTFLYAVFYIMSLYVESPVYSDFFLLLCLLMVIIDVTIVILSSRKNYQEVQSLKEINISDLYIKEAARQRYTSSVTLCIMLVALIFIHESRQFIPYLNMDDSFADSFTFTLMLLSRIYVALNEGDYDDRLDPSSVLLAREKSISAFEKKYLKMNLHEIREPLNMITVGTQYLEDIFYEDEFKEFIQSESGSAIVDSLSIIKHASSYMSKTLNVTLSSNLNKVPIYCSELLESVNMCQKIDAISRGISIETIIDPDVPSVFIGDRERIEHVIMNLLNNAIKFSPRNSTIKLIVSNGSIKPGYLTFRVIDQGIGMSESNLLGLFTPFTQFDSETNQDGKGTGVGLSMCRDLIRSLGGDIYCNSRQRPTVANQRKSPNNDTNKESYGTEFYFYVPFSLSENEKMKDVLASEEVLKTRSVSSEALAKHNIEPPAEEVNALPIRLNSFDKESPRSTCISEVSFVTTSFKSESPKNFLSINRLSGVAFRALVVDDVDSNRKILIRLLSRKGYMCEEANNGKSALNVVLSHMDEGVKKRTFSIGSLLSSAKGSSLLPPIDNKSEPISTFSRQNSIDSVGSNNLASHGLNYFHVIFMDNLMPEMNGVDIIKILRKKGFTNIIVGLTGDVTNSETSAFGSCGADYVLSKPMQTSVLNEIMTQCEDSNFKSPTFYKG